MSIRKKRFSAVIVTLVMACYLLATGAAAQENKLTTANAKITYNKEALSYGDVWSFDSDAHAQTSYNLNGAEALLWYANGGKGNTDATEATYDTNYFEKAVISGGKLDTTNSVPMKKLEFAQFNSGVQAGTVASTAVSMQIPVVKTSGDAAGIYSVVPGKTGKFYVHAYVAGASETTLSMKYAMLDNCTDTNAYAANGFSETLVLNRIEETDWYRGEVDVSTISWHAARVTGGGTSSAEDKGNVVEEAIYNGSLSLGGGEGDTTLYYYNNWESSEAHYDTVIVFQIPTGTYLGPISSEGKVVIENSDETMGTLSAQSIFGETITVSSEAQTLPNMPIVLTATAQEGNQLNGFVDAAGADIADYEQGENNANRLQAVVSGETYVYYLESDSKVSAQWRVGLALPKISVSDDATQYNFVNAKKGASTFAKGTEKIYTFTLDFADSVDFKSGTYTVTGDTINGVSSYTKEINVDENTFTVSCMYDETVVDIMVTDLEDVQYTFQYIIRPVANGDITAKNLATNKGYMFLEDALMEAQSGETIVLVKNASFVSAANGTISTKWVTNNAGYTIKDGVTLLVPFDDANTVIKDNMTDAIKNDDYTAYPAQVQYRSLTIPSGVKLTVESGGTLNVGSKAHKQMVGQTGPYGAIYLENNANITAKNNATLYVWGYIFPGSNGTGTVTAEGGSAVYEALSVMDYPGDAGTTLDLFGGHGAGASGVMSNLGGGRAFPMRDYTPRNVEVPLTFKHGAKNYVFYHLHGDSAGDHGGYVTFIGNESDGMFRLSDSAATAVKSYSNGRLLLKFEGNVSISPLVINLKVPIFGSVEINSTKVAGLYVPSCYDVELINGNGVVNDNVIFCEGTTFKIDNEATVKISSGKNLYVLDAADDLGAVTQVDVHGTYYTNVDRDAVLDINGTVIAEGGLYTSSGKASVISSEGTGKVQFSAPLGNKTIDVKYGVNTVIDDMPVTSAYLQNAGGTTYASTAAGGNYHYDAAAGAWRCENHTSNGVDDCTVADICTACGYVITPAQETHDIIIDAAVAPTCSATGLTEGQHCSRCVAVTVNQEPVDMLPHTEVTDAAVPHTCTENGLTEGKHCSVCNTVIIAQEVDPARHTEAIDLAVQPTCTETGLKEGKHCSVCNEVLLAQEVIPALGHDTVVDEAVPATCTTTGLKAGSHCSRGCEDQEVAQEVIPALGHNEVVDAAKAPSCTATGLTEGKHCDRCGETLVAQEEVAALGHSESSVVTAPDCENGGYTTYTCSVCGNVRTDDYTEALGHSWDVGVVVTPATCGAAGEMLHTCSVCEDTKTEEIAKLPHENTEVLAAVAPTCTTTGLTEGLKCNDCGQTVTEPTVVDALGHTPATDAAVEATCTETGLTEGSHCSVCSTTLVKQEVVPAKGHTVETVPGKDATCTEDGMTDGKKCTVCGTVTVEQTAIPATGHAWVDGVCQNNSEHTCSGHDYDAATGICKICKLNCPHSYTDVVTEPDCTNQGYTTHTCSICGMVTVDSYVDALGHTWKDATCTVAKTCERCRLTDGEANGHNYAHVVTAPTCTADGYTTHTCSVCKDTYTDSVTAATGHTNGAPKEENRDVNICTGGTYDTVVYCTVCGAEVSRKTETVTGPGHDYKSEVTAPTCTVDGYTTYTCQREGCGHSYTDNIVEKLGHTEVIDKAVAATCTTAGKTEGKHCSVCDAVLVAQEEIPALGHKYESAEIPPTCTEQGYTTHKCYACGNTYEDAYVDALGHDIVKLEGKEATCLDDGITEGQYCSRGCADQKVEQTIIKAQGHTEVVDEAKAATCTETGLTEGKHCDVCGEVLTAQNETPALGHNEVTDEAVAPDCENAGKTEGKHCSVCGEVFVAQEEIPALGHNHEAVVTPPTCIEDGYTTHTCANCGDSYKDTVVSAQGHTWADATCSTAKTCNVCGATEGEKLEHNYVAVVVAPTHTAKGYTQHTCSHCHDSYTTDEVAALGHNYEAAVTVEPTCTKVGKTTHTCSCGDYYYTDIPSLGHSEVADKAVAPTCTATGLTAGSHCETCGEVLDAQETVDALGHTEVVDEAVVATCTETGLTEGKHCSVCKEVLTAQNEVDALGHDYGDWFVVTEATCSSAGQRRSECSRCDVFKLEGIEKLPHSEESVEQKEATCTEPGKTAGVKCSICGEVIKGMEEIPALGHAWDKGTVTKAATCTEDGEMSFICQNDETHTKTEVIEAINHKNITTDTDWTSDDTNHWKVCPDCTEKVNSGEHEFVDGVCVCGKAEPVALTGSIRLRTAALNLEDKISIVYYASDDLIATNNDDVAERGVLLYKSRDLLATQDPDKAYETITLTWNNEKARYVGQSNGIDARDMDKSQFAVAYLKMKDGTYILGTKEGAAHSVEYSPLIYCQNKKDDATVGKLCRALMHYGAAAQVEQYKMTSGLMNEGFDPIPYDETVLGDSVFGANTNIINGMKLRSVALDLKGAITYIVQFSIEDSSISDKQLYAEYTLLGQTNSVELAPAANGRLEARISGVPAKDMGATIRVKAYYLDDNGNRVYGGELVYSGYEYVRRAVPNTTYTEAVRELSKALAMYIYYADIYGN